MNSWMAVDNGANSTTWEPPAAWRCAAPDDGLLELIDIYGNDRIAFRAGKAISVMAYDPAR